MKTFFDVNEDYVTLYKSPEQCMCCACQIFVEHVPPNQRVCGCTVCAHNWYHSIYLGKEWEGWLDG